MGRMWKEVIQNKSNYIRVALEVGGLEGCWVAAPQTPPSEILKNSDFVDIMVSKIYVIYP
jgi:hypothetical protein